MGSAAPSRRRRLALPDPLARLLVAALPPGPVLEIGAGEGYESLHLARAGFEVEAVERDAARVSSLRRRAMAAGVRVTVRHADARRFEPAGPYEAVLILRVLHQMAPGEARAVLSRLQAATRPGGLNVIAALTDRGGLADSLVDDGRFIERGDLDDAYRSWQIVARRRRFVPLTATGPGGLRLRHEQLALVAQKPEEA